MIYLGKVRMRNSILKCTFISLCILTFIGTSKRDGRNRASLDKPSCKV